MSITPNSDKISQFFTVAVQYKIPIYQRRYVWDEDNWETLWKDIEENSDNYYFKGLAQNHFTGTIVTQEIKASGLLTDTYEIIDGQQRLTTFQIIFCVIRDLCNTESMEDSYDIAKTLGGFIRNEPRVGRGLKLLLTEFDSDAFEAVVRAHQLDNIDHKICGAYKYFEKKFKNYIEHNYKDSSEPQDNLSPAYRKLHALYQSISSNFQVVEIPAGEDYESQKIFETLNATGRRLSEFDYLRNNLFLRAGAGQEDITKARAERDRLYEDYWSEFEVYYNDWDDDKLEEFLRDFLLAKRGFSFKRKEQRRNLRVFDAYQEYSEDLQSDQGVEYEVSQLRDYGLVYKDMNSSTSKISRQMQFYDDLEIADLSPFILYMISELNPNEDEIEQLFHILESCLIQSMLTGNLSLVYKKVENFYWQIKSQDTTSLDLRSFRNSLSWPSKNQVEEALRKAGTKKSKLIRYILYRIECLKRKTINNPDIDADMPCFSLFKSLEHIMPQSWRDRWPLDSSDGLTPEDLYLGNLYTRVYKKDNPNWQSTPSEHGLVDSKCQRYLDAHDLAINRIKVEQSIGNLTPINEKTNRTHLSHNSFVHKKEFLSKPGRSNLVLTQEIIQHDSWDAAEIANRELDLLEKFFQLWPIRT
ncbi:MAG: DUF262 domain-containing HNH endonuclease family protein [Candidatus Poribacteria bacterium]|nr:DUF262 domain-containing HNH endonuclease family protein [Candidatus Poribacteria bacterium]